MIRGREPMAWSLFAAGGTAAALLLPALFLVLFLAAPLGWGVGNDPGAWADPHGSAGMRLLLAGLLPFLFFHAAHRLRYTLHDGLQLHHLDRPITLATYGVALVLSAIALLLPWIHLP
jgi:fumarate reductase subunit D